MAIIGVLVALLLPAVQAAHEAARRAQCVNNLKQLALAAANYETTVGAYPLGSYWMLMGGQDGSIWISVNCGPMPLLAPYVEQGPLYNAINFMGNIYSNANLTVHAIGMSTLWCPSDTSVNSIQTLDGNSAFFDAVPPGQSARMAYSSYGGVVGPWLGNTIYLPGFLVLPDHGAVKANQLGMFNVCSDVRLASVTDGTSHTMSFAEHSHGMLQTADQPNWHWWDSGILGNTLITTMWPLNPQRQIQDLATGDFGDSIFIVSASSFHPGGANFAFVDGSVRFIKDTVQSWPLEPLGQDLFGEALPASVSWSFAANGFGSIFDVIYRTTPGYQFGVYQALSTRNLGEVISSGAY
jgi:prepilin-type processing-associated H-X9-DG protein